MLIRFYKFYLETGNVLGNMAGSVIMNADSHIISLNENDEVISLLTFWIRLEERRNVDMELSVEFSEKFKQSFHWLLWWNGKYSPIRIIYRLQEPIEARLKIFKNLHTKFHIFGTEMKVIGKIS